MLLMFLGPQMPVLRLEYETEGFIPAVEVGKLLSEMDAAFQRFVKARYRRSGAHLAIQKVEVGSLVADFVVVTAGSAMTMAQHPEILSSFVSNIANLVTIAQGLGKGWPKANDRRLLDALQAPIAHKNAHQVNVYIVGDGNSVKIDQDVVTRIAEADEERTEIKALTGPPAPKAGVEQLSDRPVLLRLQGKMGTALHVKGRWYVRLEGEGGVLNPVSNGSEIDLQDDHAYAFDGAWEGRSYHIKEARPLLR